MPKRQISPFKKRTNHYQKETKQQKKAICMQKKKIKQKTKEKKKEDIFIFIKETKEKKTSRKGCIRIKEEIQQKKKINHDAPRKFVIIPK